MRTLSSALLRSKNEIDQAAPWGFLLELRIAQAPAPFRFTSDIVATTFHGQAYVPYPIEISGIEESAEEIIQRATLTVPAADGQLLGLLASYWETVVAVDWEVWAWQVDLTQPNETPLVMREVFTVEGVTVTLPNDDGQVSVRTAAALELAASGKTVAQTIPQRVYNRANGYPLIPRI